MKKERFLAGDVGGTKTLLGLFDEELSCIEEKEFYTQKYTSLEEMVFEFLKDKGISLHKACFGVAGPVREGKCKMTNLPWELEEKKLQRTLRIPQISLINDLEASGYGLFYLPPEDFIEIQKGKNSLPGNVAIISLGTGLGEAFLLWTRGQYESFSSEGGHVDFAPQTPLEIELFLYLKGNYGHVSYERVLSGQGLEEIYQFISKKVPLKASEISEKALKKECPLCEKALDLFISIYGAEAGNMALKFFALSGIYLGGGIAPKIVEKLRKGSFLKSFLYKGRFSSFLSTIPIKVILNPKVSLIGAAHYVNRRGPTSLRNL